MNLNFMASIKQIELSGKELASLLAMSEGHFLDFKSKKIKPASLTKTMSAFANAEGGELFVGIEDNMKWDGFADQESANGHLQAFEEVFPLGTEFQYEFLANKTSAGLVLHVQVAKSREIKAATNSTVYARRGAQNLSIKDEAKLTALKRSKGIATFETETVNCPLDVLTSSEPFLEFLKDVVPTAEPEPWLRKQMLVAGDLPIVAAVILYADEPQAILPKRTGIKVYRYKTSDPVGTRETLEFAPISIEGCAYTQIYAAVKKTAEIIESVSVRVAGGMEQVAYPQDALHEIITNAVIHRDYAVTDDIHIRVFDNRVEVLSPGPLPGHVTVKNILNERYSRNPATVRLINKFPNPPNKDVGEGLNTAFESMRQMKLKSPVIEQTDGYVMVVLKHESLATPQEAVLKYLLTHDEIANRNARAAAYIESENKMKRILKGMVDDGLIEIVPDRDRFHAAYQLTEDGLAEAEKLG